MNQSFHHLSSSKIHFSGALHSSTHWAGIVAKYVDVFCAHSANKWLLYEQDSFIFSALFYALLASGKSIVLPQNGQPEHINEVKKSVDASVGHISILPTVVADNIADDGTEISLSISADAEIIFYTSGSTGAPKVIKKQYRLLQLEVDALEKEFSAVVSGSLFISTVPHQHIYGLLFKMLWPISKGHTLVCQSFEYPEQMVNQILESEQAAVTIISSPAQLHRIVTDNPLIAVRKSVKNIFSSGGPLDAHKNMALQQDLACNILEVFGSTETGGIGWRQKQSQNENDWQAFSGITLSYQASSDLLAVSSPYIQKDIHYADDRVELLSDDRFRVLGRADSVVKIEEKRISLDEVQNRLKQHELVDDAFVVVIGTTRKKLAALVVLNQAGLEVNKTHKKLQLDRMFKGFLANWYEPILLPKKYRYPPELPYNARGKLSRREAESYFE